MASTITYPPGLQAAAAELGVILPKHEKFAAKGALLELVDAFDVASMHGEDDWSDFGGFSLKKFARGIGRGVKSVGKGIGKGITSVARNPIAQIINPAFAIGVHTTSRALGGKGVIKGTLGKIVDAGTKVATAGVGGKALTGIAGGKAVAFAIPSRMIPIQQAMAGADKLLGDPNVKNARAVIRNTQAMAALGDPAAKRGLSVLTAVGHIRLAKATPVGQRAVPHVLTVPPAALTVRRSPVQVRKLAVKKAAEKPKGFWARFVAWIKG
jgi:hypothetical protein